MMQLPHAARAARNLFVLLALLLSLCACAVERDSGARQRWAVAAIVAAEAPVGTPGNPGFVIGVSRHGKVLLAQGYGDADLEHDIAISADSAFYVASVSKSFTAFAIALLVRAGTVDLDADIHRYLPSMPDFGHRVTVRNLIEHTSGLRDYGLLAKLTQHSRADWLWQEQAVNLVRRQHSLAFEPGTQAVYSNSGYLLLAEIVHSVSGKTLREFTTQHLFEPLGMTRTVFADDATEIIRGRVRGYARAGEGWRTSPLNAETVGGTGVVTTVEDMLKWLRNYGAPRVGDAALVERITTPAPIPVGGNDYNFGVITKSVSGQRAIVLGGEAEAFRATGYYFPDQDLAVAVMANNLGALTANQLATRVAAVYLDTPQPLRAVAEAGHSTPYVLDAVAASGITGFYLPAAGGWSVELRQVDGRLWWATTLRDAAPLYTDRDGAFCVGVGSAQCFRFERDAGGVITGFQSTAVDAERFLRQPPVSQHAIDAILGAYRIEELDTTYTLQLENGRLVARTLWSVDATAKRQSEWSLWSPVAVTLTAVAPDRFESNSFALGVLQPRRGAMGAVTGLEIVLGSLLGMCLERSTGNGK